MTEKDIQKLVAADAEYWEAYEDWKEYACRYSQDRWRSACRELEQLLWKHSSSLIAIAADRQKRQKAKAGSVKKPRRRVRA